MKRRELITLLGGAAAVWPLAARAQQATKTYHMALVHPSVSIADMSESGGNPIYAALFKELRRLGYIEGVNLVISGDTLARGGRTIIQSSAVRSYAQIQMSSLRPQQDSL